MKKKIKEKRFRKSHRYKIKKPFYKKKIFIYSFISISISIVLFYFLIFFSFFQINNIDISGNKKINSNELINFLDKKLSKSFLFLNSKSILIFFPTKIAPEILNEFPEISSLKLKRVYPNQINLEIKERRLIGTSCNSDCFYFDLTGKIFEKTENKKGLIVETNNRDYSLGNDLFSKKEIESILLIWRNTKDYLDIMEFKIINYELSVTTNQGYYIRFNIEDDIDFQIIKLDLVLTEKIPLNESKNLEYIDLRFGKIINYKYRNQNLINVVDEN
jgi:cell division septal protein FtsQ